MTYIRDPNAFDPTAYSAAHDRVHTKDPGFIHVTALSHPALFHVFETISADNGGGAGHDNYSVPNPLGERAQHAEDFLLKLTKEERETVASGEHLDAQDVMNRHATSVQEREDVNEFLEMFFNDWEEA